MGETPSSAPLAPFALFFDFALRRYVHSLQAVPEPEPVATAPDGALAEEERERVRKAEEWAAEHVLGEACVKRSSRRSWSRV